MEYRGLPDMNGWATLRAVVERGGVSEAARALHVGQPAVSKRLRALDDCYGTPLTERIGGRLRLTEAGERVYLLAVQALDRHAALHEDLQKLSAGRTRLRLEGTFAIGEHMLPDLLVQFTEVHPEYTVESRMGYSRELQMHLAGGLSDLALLESAPDHPDILVQKWLDDELLLVCGSGHPLAGAGSLALEQVPQLSFVLRERRSSIREVGDQALRDLGIERLRIAMEVGSTDAIVEILDHGRHASFLPRFAVRERLAQGTLYHLNVVGFRVPQTLWIARHRSNLDHPVAEAFIELLRRNAGTPGGASAG